MIQPHDKINDRSQPGFTLVELLVVIAILSMLMGLLLPALQAARSVAKSIHCQSNLRSIALACEGYATDNDHRFLQGLQVNHDFAGWQGIGGFAASRPVNPYLDLPQKVTSKQGAQALRCPADAGGVLGISPQEEAYDYFGNSYQTNIFMIGPNQTLDPRPEYEPLYWAINQRLKSLGYNDISDPSRLLLVGDNNWMSQWSFAFPPGTTWHGRKQGFNMAFIDGHVAMIKIKKDQLLGPDYRILPFTKLDKLIPEQDE